MLQQKSIRLVISSLLVVVFAFPAFAQEEKQKKKGKKPAPSGTAILWREPVDLESRNLLLGAGGERMKPDLRRITFVEKKTGGYSTKYRVKDASGNEWVAKIGKEAQPDTAANRLVWAVGYESEIAYLVPKLTIEGKGSFENVRLEARPKFIDRGDSWAWDQNPFANKPELKGLKVMMLLINNWDIKDSNNVILAVKNESTGENELRYIISDLGGSLGKTGGFFSRSRNEPIDFIKSNFIESVRGNVIDFNYGGKSQALFDNITTTDAKWIGGLLARLSDTQIADAFRAANYSPDEVLALSQAVRRRINALNDVSASIATAP
jgi:hypothetical protein